MPRPPGYLLHLCYRRFSPTLRAAAPYPTTKRPRLSFSPINPVFTGTSNLPTRMGPDFSLAMRKPSDTQEPCNATVSDERRRSNIGSHVRLTFGTAAKGLAHFAPLPGSNSDHNVSWASASCEISFPCQMDIYLFRRDCFIEAIRFTSVPAEADPPSQNFFARRRMWLDPSTPH